MNSDSVNREIEQMQLNRNAGITDIAELVWYDLADEGHQLANDDGTINWEFLHRYDLVFARRIAEECAMICDNFQARDVGMQPSECAGAIRHRFGISHEPKD